MFGSYRAVLALCVVAQHYFGFAPLGNFAVFGFFCLSGFLMTLLMNGPYAGRPFVFAANRFLRIFPSYWLVAAVSAAYILLKPLPELIGGTTLIGVPTEWSEIIKQTILVISGSDRPMIVPVAWSLTNELVFYALIAAGISKTPMRAILWLMASALIAALEMHTRDFYYDIRAASLPFALGAVAFHFTRSDLFAVLARWKSGAALAANAVLICAVALPALHIVGGGMLTLYAVMAANCLAIVSLYAIRPVGVWKRTDEFLGALSYPLYLVHLLVLLLVRSTGLAPHQYQAQAAVLLAVGLSVLIVRYVDDPIERLRGTLRSTPSSVHGSRPVMSSRSLATDPQSPPLRDGTG